MPLLDADHVPKKNIRKQQLDASSILPRTTPAEIFAMSRRERRALGKKHNIVLPGTNEPYVKGK